ncbi:MAG TPA: hypothetical protein VJK53_01770 [Candidatus Paceibacterota bacterium]
MEEYVVPEIRSVREFILHAMSRTPGLQKIMLEQCDRIEAGQPPRKVHPELDAQFEHMRRHFQDAA